MLPFCLSFSSVILCDRFFDGRVYLLDVPVTSGDLCKTNQYIYLKIPKLFTVMERHICKTLSIKIDIVGLYTNLESDSQRRFHKKSTLGVALVI